MFDKKDVFSFILVDGLSIMQREQEHSLFTESMALTPHFIKRSRYHMFFINFHRYFSLQNRGIDGF